MIVSFSHSKIFDWRSEFWPEFWPLPLIFFKLDSEFSQFLRVAIHSFEAAFQSIKLVPTPNDSQFDALFVQVCSCPNRSLFLGVCELVLEFLFSLSFWRFIRFSLFEASGSSKPQVLFSTFASQCCSLLVSRQWHPKRHQSHSFCISSVCFHSIWPLSRNRYYAARS